LVQALAHHLQEVLLDKHVSVAEGGHASGVAFLFEIQGAVAAGEADDRDIALSLACHGLNERHRLQTVKPSILSHLVLVHLQQHEPVLTVAALKVDASLVAVECVRTRIEAQRLQPILSEQTVNPLNTFLAHKQYLDLAIVVAVVGKDHLSETESLEFFLEYNLIGYIRIFDK
jgi:hypothetical protein